MIKYLVVATLSNYSVDASGTKSICKNPNCQFYKNL